MLGAAHSAGSPSADCGPGSAWMGMYAGWGAGARREETRGCYWTFACSIRTAVLQRILARSFKSASVCLATAGVKWARQGASDPGPAVHTMLPSPTPSASARPCADPTNLSRSTSAGLLLATGFQIHLHTYLLSLLLLCLLMFACFAVMILFDFSRRFRVFELQHTQRTSIPFNDYLAFVLISFHSL